MEYSKLNKLFNFILVIIVIIIFQNCKTYQFRSNYKDVSSLLHQEGEGKLYLKAHLKNGDVCILRDTWKIDTTKNELIGVGDRYDFNRNKIYNGDIFIPVDSISIFETNKKLNETEIDRLSTLSILTAANVGLFVFCQSNPKMCYGSCPTFYLDEFADFHYADAEGFTNAISPSMKYRDIDALNNPKVLNSNFSITMKNEALETHCLDAIKLLAYPRLEGERIYHSSNNEFYLCNKTYPVSLAIGEEGNITSLLKYDDYNERFSLSDENNMLSEEIIYLDFDSVEAAKDLGLSIHFRQTLMTTYLFYSALGYMGDEISDIFAILERDSTMRNKFDATTQLLGGMKIYLFDEKNNKWIFQNELTETGPIAVNKQFIPFKKPNISSKVKIKIVLNKGLWRIDYVALAGIKQKVNPIELIPISIFHDGIADEAALKNITSDGKYLVSMPGNKYKLNFKLPENNTDYELFLSSKGYYLEWMRSSWIKDKNLLKLKQMVDFPKFFLKREASNFKEYEATMEEQFWNSKIDTKIISCNEK